MRRSRCDLLDGSFACAEAAGHRAAQHVGADVGGHNPDGVLRVYGVALGIGQATGVKHLQEEIKHFWMGFFHFIEQDDAVRAAAQFARQLAFLVMPDVARRSADHARNGVLLHVFRHVNADQVFIGAKDFSRQRARQFGFANAGRA